MRPRRQVANACTMADMLPAPTDGVTLAGGEIGSLSYERALEELDGLIARLEAGRVDLDEAITCYERGTRLAQHCERLLDRTEQKVTQVVVGSGGEREQPFDPLPAPSAGTAPAAGPAGREDAAPRRAASVGSPSTFNPTGLEGRPQAPPVDPDDVPF